MSSHRYQLHDLGHARVVELMLPSSIEAEEFDELNSLLADVLSTPTGGRWVVDLAQVSYSGSALLGLLINLRSRVRASKGILVFCALQPPLHAILRTSSMEKLFSIAANRNDAVVLVATL